jgi:hypothetical protein
MREFPKIYKILPESIKFEVPGFLHHRPGKVLALSKRDCGEWFHGFVDRVIAACGQKYLPVCRMSDGEFYFCAGNQPPSIRLPWLKQKKIILRQKISKILKGGQFLVNTQKNVSSGKYSKKEWRGAQSRYSILCRKISEKGILALHLSYGSNPFQEHYFPAFNQWLLDSAITLTEDNYVPFYFVYAMLTGPWRAKVFKGKRVLVVHSATGAKQQCIIKSLEREGVAEVFWCSISPSRSLFDHIEISGYIGRVDVAIVGAGVGKPNILVQLEALQVPCIDAGYVFEVWANPENQWRRAFCVPDEKFDINKGKLCRRK